MVDIGYRAPQFHVHKFTSSLLEIISGMKGLIATTQDAFSQSRIVWWPGTKMALTELSEIVGITIANH